MSEELQPAGPKDDGAEQFYQEIHRMVNRYASESGLTYRQCFGVLEHVKLDLAHEFYRAKDGKRNDE